MKIFVTGGTGYIGERVVKALTNRGDQVHLLCRYRRHPESLSSKNVRVCFGDVLNPASLEAAMEGCERVIHLAGYAKNWASDPTIFQDINVQGTRNVLETGLRFGVKKVVCVSSIVVFGPSNGRPLDERTRRLVSFYTEYERTKFLADDLRGEFLEKNLPLVSVYPTRVYGPGKDTESNSLSRVLQLYLRGKFPFLLNGGKEIANYAFVEDVAAGILLALDRGKAGKRYILGGENASLSTIFDIVDRRTGQKHLRISIPPTVARAVARIAEWSAKTFGVYPLITPGWVETFLQNWAASSAAAVNDLGYRVTPLEVGLRETLQWLMERQEQK